MKRLKVWGISNQDTAVQLYRINQPLRYIAKQKLATVHTMPFFGQHANHLTSGEFSKYFELEGKWADVLVSTVASNREYLALLLALKDLYKLKLVIDLDDDILSTHLEVNNPAHTAFMDPRLKLAEYAQACIREADLLVVSTEHLKKVYSSINPNIVVIKNFVDPKLFRQKSVSDDITIGYAGSGSHQKDWEMVEPILIKLKEKYGVKVKVLGPVNTKIADWKNNWVDTLKYPDTLASMGISIGIAPLKDTMMARAKSNLRWLEYSAYKIPTVASDVVPFRECKNIILASEPEDWGAALEKLITDNEYRTALGEAAYNEAREKYDPKYWSGKLYDAINGLFDGREPRGG